MNNTAIVAVVIVIVLVVILVAGFMMGDDGTRGHSRLHVIAPTGDVIEVDVVPGNNIVTLTGPIDNSTAAQSLDLVLNAATGQCIGDSVMLFFGVTTPTGGNATLINFPSNVVLTACGGFVTSRNIQAYETWNSVFYYDGSQFINTFDNC